MKVFAHRGFSGQYPENTILAFDKAHELGVDGFELDVQLTKDGKIVVFHDQFLERTTNGLGRLAQYALQELKQYDAGQGEHIPTLAELLKAYYLGPQLMIELKYHSARNYQPLVDALVKLLKQLKLKYAPVFCSFNWPALVYLRCQSRNINIAVLHKHKPFLRVLKMAKLVKACAISTPLNEVSSRKVELARIAGLNMYVWTVNSKKQATLCRHLGVFGVISNFPDEVRP
ncbi:MAG: glycerophosphodiester phosphodiesterase family protein [bacterium]|nr:glycerophosphodiester phosphodiesterase family protein [bacterium]